MSGRKHVGELAESHSVLDWLIEWFHEVMGGKDRDVGVLALLLLEGMAIDDGEAIIVVLLGDEYARVLTESADLVFEWSWVAD